MFIGLDMGGTHTDAVLIAEGQVKKHYKVKTDHDNYLHTVTNALDYILAGTDPRGIERINLSTTVCTNAIVTKNTSPVGLLIEPGPGLDPRRLSCGDKFFILSGAVDHRGHVTAPLDREELIDADKKLQESDIKNLAIVGKFSTRNPEHELSILEAMSPGYRFVTLGHRLSGRLNFPRRVFSAYFNSAVASVYGHFATAIQSYCNEKKLPVPPNILKADGGTLSLEAAKELPVETILSGPSASIMGCLSLAPTGWDAVILDIGGTTTDIAFLADGVPLFEPRGISLGGYPTLVRALYSCSIGLGGDSSLKVSDGKLTIGPERLGPAFALGGPCATPTDALIVLGRLEIGDKTRAAEAMAALGEKLGLNVNAMAQKVISDLINCITLRTRTLLREINGRPVYTVREVLEDKRLQPRHIIAIGAPAASLVPELEAGFGLPLVIPRLSGVANAVGAAMSLPTTEITLLADTEEQVLIVPEEGIREKIPHTFTLDAARERALGLLARRMQRLSPAAAGAEMEIIEEQSFNMVSGFFTTGKNIRVKAQVKPQVLTLKEGAKNV